jgi:hypothetical protein
VRFEVTCHVGHQPSENGTSQSIRQKDDPDAGR